VITFEERFIEFQKQHALINPGQKVLLGCSGGVDSMVLAYLFLHASIRFDLAHVNYGLRGESSVLDEKHVKDWCQTNAITCHVLKVSQSHWEEHDGSVQMKARKIRYAFYRELMSRQGIQRMATAHHIDDKIETILLNLLRGTGIEGLQGIKPMQGSVIRPLLFARKSEIIHFAGEKGIIWREDASNESTYYRRNYIRKQIIPQFEKLNPSFVTGMDRFAQRMEVVQKQFFKSLQHILRTSSKKEGDRFYLQRSAFQSTNEGTELLYYLIKSYGFSREDSRSLLTRKHSQPGALYASASHQLLIDRSFFIIEPKSDLSHSIWPLHLKKQDSLARLPHDQQLKWQFHQGSMLIPNDPNVALLDAGLLKWPLEIRPWAAGDRMQPIGMIGEKKISDLLIDLKIDRLRKKDLLVLCSEGKIVWLIGLKISEAYKVTQQTNELIRFQCD
jgi:tRNA(Ile)-lysidine synthase